MTDSGLSEFQVELATLFFSLPESAGFLLAGGGALIAQGIVPRPTEDLDFFTSRQHGGVDAASDALIAAVTERGWSVELKRTGEEFRRWEITGPEVVLIDLAVDSPPTGAPTVTIAGPSFAPAELAVRKTLALFGRAEPRDYVDVYVLNQRFDRADTVRAAAEADLGFDLAVFAQTLRSHQRVADQDFPDIGVPITDIRAYFDVWADEVDPR
ncbi:MULTISPECIES: nucleotidyl transferase AbiEii/AbiGii toxin family protein [Aeromicrobium]|uniref:nucleotidyl transferase AbiEii/AbiGii toxin family protein n=1 Tax=Aeromicrobium TaxID=2040 RepID=UPI00258097C3|nr:MULTISPECIES: nucleotidyl transferase AbiEii/AbiGii toxin family protein [Aeromicrobium]